MGVFQKYFFNMSYQKEGKKLDKDNTSSEACFDPRGKLSY
jgi:hypothetical protein